MATRDRLNELKSSNSLWTSVVNIDEECCHLTSDELKTIEEIRSLIETIELNTTQFQDLYNNNPFSSELHSTLKNLFEQSQKSCYEVGFKLKSFRLDLENVNDLSTTSYRMKNVHYTGFCQRYKEALKNQESWSQRVHNERKDFIQKCNQIVSHSQLDDESLEKLVHQETTVFTQNYLAMEQEARLMLCDLEARNKELLMIEQHLQELKQLFVQLALLIEEQQESVNRIEYHTVSTGKYVENSRREMATTEKIKRRHLKCKIIIAATVFVLIIVVIASLLN